MKRFYLIAILLIPSLAHAQFGDFRDFGPNQSYQILNDVTNFDHLLTSSDTTVQSALETIDELPQILSTYETDPIAVHPDGTNGPFTADILFGSDNTYDFGSASNVAAETWTRNIYGGDATSDSLNLYAHNQAFSVNNTGRINIYNRIVFKSPTSLDVAQVFPLMSFSETVTTDGLAAAIPIGLDFRPRVEFDTPQNFSNALAFFARESYVEASALSGAHGEFTVGGYGSSPAMLIGHDGTGQTVPKMTPYSASVNLRRDAGVTTGTITVTDASLYRTFSPSALTALAPNMSAGATITELTHFNAYNAGSSSFNKGGGSVGTEIGLNLAGLVAGTNRIGIRSNIAQAAAGDYFISHTGNTGSRFGGHIEITADSKWVKFGAGGDAAIYYNGSNLIVDPDAVGSGIVLIGASGDDDMRLTNMEIDGALNHDGSTVGFYGVTPTARSTGWTLSNVSSDKTFDADSTTVDELADILGTLINHLITRGDLST